MMRIVSLGHGGGVPNPYGNTNFLIYPDGQDPWLLDCGPDTARKILQEEIPVQGILLTHLHDDHSGGLKSLAYNDKYKTGFRRKLVYPARLQEGLDQQFCEMQYFSAHYKLDRDWSAYFQPQSMHPCTWVDLGGASATPFPVHHGLWSVDTDDRDTSIPSQYEMPAFGWIVQSKGGDRVMFSGDTYEPVDYLVDWLQKPTNRYCIHDVQFYDNGNNGSHVHCPYKHLRDAVPADLRHKVLLTHYGATLPSEARVDGFGYLEGLGEVYVR